MADQTHVGYSQVEQSLLMRTCHEHAFQLLMDDSTVTQIRPMSCQGKD